jgi:hypothetical protein
MTSGSPFAWRRSRWSRPIAVAVACGLLACGGASVPVRLSDQEFWRLTTELSEPAGSFTHSDNLVSNEALFADTMRTLRSRGGVYVGVGPEQNFSYIAAIRPVMAFIVDVRAENRGLHLLYKALFEMSVDRAEFVSRLFSRARPPGVGAETPVQDLFDKFASAPAQHGLRDDTARLARQRLLNSHGFAVEPRELAWIDYALEAFAADGPDIHYARLLPHDPRGPSYRTLMTAADVTRHGRSFLATEAGFRFVKELQARNLIVPVIGDFGGPTALLRTGEYIRQHRQIVTAFYGSNVEVYLNREKNAVFCLNLAKLPYNWSTYFIGSKGKQPLRLKLAACGALTESGSAAPGPQ